MTVLDATKVIGPESAVSDKNGDVEVMKRVVV
jgi:hypothetical protein